MSQTNQYQSILLRRPQVENMTGLKRSSIYALMRCGQFPRPVKLSARAVAWHADMIQTWILERTSAAARVSRTLGSETSTRAMCSQVVGSRDGKK